MECLNDFIVHYTESLLWSSSDGDHESLEGFELSDQARKAIAEDCQAFIGNHAALIRQAVKCYGLGHTAHDYALTRNHHGAGFWDGDLPNALGKALTEAAHAMGQQSPYLGDDGLVYV